MFSKLSSRDKTFILMTGMCVFWYNCGFICGKGAGLKEGFHLGLNATNIFLDAMMNSTK